MSTTRKNIDTNNPNSIGYADRNSTPTFFNSQKQEHALDAYMVDNDRYSQFEGITSNKDEKYVPEIPIGEEDRYSKYGR